MLKLRIFKRLKDYFQVIKMEFEKYIDTIFNVLDKPTLEFIPEEKDGAFGIKNGDVDMFFAYLKEDNKIFGIINIMFRKNINCYQIINIVPIVISKNRNINNNEFTPLDKNTYESSIKQINFAK